ncbi:cytochrome P450 89A2-like [Vitis riparia]|uniref:cytochrome P450 89A2-like n=1 Tax=Vitis riparia TaxID=96939 RepID=UPI00155A9CFB|nr:cytochrome P450 89A2-like [Vitis riparia]
MEVWIFVFISISVATLLISLSHVVFPKPRLPPGPIRVPLIGNFIWFGISFSDVESTLRNVHDKYGPIIALQFGSRLAVFISTNSLAHQALIQNGAIFSDRPHSQPTYAVISRNGHNVSCAHYGPTWRLLRRNLTLEILHPSRIRLYSHARKWALEILKSRLQCHSESVPVMDHFLYTMFCLLVFMCFGCKLDEGHIQEIGSVVHRLTASFISFQPLNFWPMVGKILFRKRWREFLQICKDEEEVLIPLIRGRQRLNHDMQRKQKQDSNDLSSSSKDYFISYVDTLLDLQLPDEKRKLNEGEIVSLCSEFLGAGTDTTSTALQWIMANLVKYPHIQVKLFEEIMGVVGVGEKEVKEEDLQKMPYLKAVILEGLRRHPPGHFVSPHSVTQDVVLDGYIIPKNTIVNFMVAEIGRNPNVWEDPMEFKPERFLNKNGDGDGGEVFDITGSSEIKMMPFGAGRRMCPGYGLAMLHLEYFVANLVWSFEWKAVEGDEVDLSEKQELSTVMKNPLKARLSPRD